MFANPEVCLNASNSQSCALFSTVPNRANSEPLHRCLPANYTLLQVALYVLRDSALNASLSYNALVEGNQSSELQERYVYCSPQGFGTSHSERSRVTWWCILSVIIIIVVVATVCDYSKLLHPGSGEQKMFEMRNDEVKTRDSHTFPPTSTHVNRGGIYYGTGNESLTLKSDYCSEVAHTSGLNRSSHIGCVGLPLLTPEQQLAARTVADGSLRTVGFVDKDHSWNCLVQEGSEPQGTQKGNDNWHHHVDVGAVAGLVPVCTQKFGSVCSSNKAESCPLDAEELNKFLRGRSPDGLRISGVKSVGLRAVECLSLIGSYQKWRSYPDSDMNLFNGLRVLTFLWVMAFGTFWFTQRAGPVDHSDSLDDSIFHTLLGQRVFSACAISTFLVIAGFLTLHHLHICEESRMRSPTARVRWSRGTRRQFLLEGMWSYVRYMVSRFIRVIPVTLTITFAVPGIIPVTASGPLWKVLTSPTALRGNCGDYWWTNLLLVNNILPAAESKRCFPWSYYVALECQLVATGPLIHWLSRSLNSRAFISVLTACMVTSMLLRHLCLTYREPLHLKPGGVAPHTLDIGATYQWPHLMFVPFCAGVILHYTYIGVQHRSETLHMFGPDLFTAMHHSPESVTMEDRLSFFILEKLHLRSVRFLVMWGGTGMMVLCLFWEKSAYHAPPGSAYHPIYESVILLPWCIGLCMLIFPLLFGYGGAVHRFLAHRLWSGPSRLVLGAYLLIPIVVGSVNLYWGPINARMVPMFVVWWLLCTAATFLVSFTTHMLVERPCLHASSQGKY